MFVHLAFDKSFKSWLIKASDVTGCNWSHGAADSETVGQSLAEDTGNVCSQ